MVTRYKAKVLRPHYIREWLEHLEVNQTELARRMETDKANINRWLKYPRRVNLDVLSGVADALNIEDAGDLLRPPASAIARDQAMAAARQLLGALAPAQAQNGRQRG